MAELLLEILTEEIPARMQEIAARELERLTGIALEAADLSATRIESLVTPRRLALVVTGLPLAQPGAAEERRGPRVGAPPSAVEGFLKSAGLAALDQCERRSTEKGEFYFAVIHRPGRATADVLPKLLGEVIRILPWPKSMRFPAANFRWVRPITSLLLLFDGAVLDLGLDGLPVGDKTLGHRFLSPGPIKVRDFADYCGKLRAAHVILDPIERRARIVAELAQAAKQASLLVKEDPELLEEVTGLVEWPVVLLGRIDPSFMELPPEVLTASMRTHQKYFACLDAKGSLAPNFLVVANVPAVDSGKLIVAGNERVLRARLSDAKFFWDQDRKSTLASRLPKLAERVFHAKLGSMLDKVRRVMSLAEALVPHLSGAETARVNRAAELMKADLSSGMVGEFPELQGVMGRYYALHDGEKPEVAEAIAEHYSPLGPTDRCPTAPTSVAIALADKIDTLVQFFAIDEKPTGSKDPYALRRAALGVIRLVLENRLRLPLAEVFQEAAGNRGKAPTAELLDFFADRLKVALRDKGVRHDLIAAVFALGGEDDLVRLLARVEALDAFLKTEDGANLLVAYRRAANIVRIEEKKDGTSYAGAADMAHFTQKEEQILAERLDEAAVKSSEALAREAFSVAMGVLSGLRAPVDAFFSKVTVNVEDRALRMNRLLLLSQIRDTLNRVADFSQIEG